LKQDKPLSVRSSNQTYLATLETIIFAAFCWYAAWSIQTLNVVFFHLPFHDLKYATVFAGVASLVLVWMFSAEALANPAADHKIELKIYLPTLLSALAAFIILVGAIFFIKKGNSPIFIAVILVSLYSGLLPATVRERTISDLPISPKIILIFGIGIGILFYLFSHRFDLDDANFVNLAVGARRFDGPVLDVDTMLGHGPGPIHLPTYRVHSFELLVATLADLLALPTIDVAHIVVPLLFTILFVIAVARIGYESIRNDWIGAFLLLLALQLFAGTTLDGWGIHGLTRFFEGKAEFVTIVVPLLIYYSYRAIRDGRLLDFIMIAVLQISAVGLTANALYGAPLAVGLASLSAAIAQGLNKITIARFLGINATSIYPVAIGAALLFTGNAFPSGYPLIPKFCSESSSVRIMLAIYSNSSPVPMVPVTRSDSSLALI
jgi:hypothetical protein